MEVIDGNRIAAEIIAELRAEVATIQGRKPCLALVRVGEDPASVSYVRKKGQTAAEVGIESRNLLPPVTIGQAALETLIEDLNADPSVDGILVQSPLPANLDERAVFGRITPEKDVDGFNPVNLGKLAQEDDTGFTPCTPAGIMELLARSAVDLEGKHVVILGRSLIVGKPAAIGRAGFVTADMVKPGVVVIDVGITRVADASKKAGYRLAGDVDFPGVSALASRITPVPGGVGPMTVALLMRNTVKAYRLRTAG